MLEYITNNNSLFRYKRVYLPLCKVADTSFHIQEDELTP